MGKGVTVGRSPHRKLGPDMQGRSPQANLPEGNSLLPAMGVRKRVSLRSPVRKNCTPGSVRGASGNRRPYRDGHKSDQSESRIPWLKQNGRECCSLKQGKGGVRHNGCSNYHWSIK
jgi:hypothetical protein